MDHPLPFIQTLEILDSLLPENLRKPLVGIVCGSGLSGLVESFKDVVKIPYEKLPGFAKSTGMIYLLSCYIVIDIDDWAGNSAWTQERVSFWAVRQ
jgi:purine nucleoside phosphorylase